MEVRHCDICGEIIKNTVYIVQVLKSSYKKASVDDLELMSTQQFMSKLKERQKQIKVKEICPGCAKVWDYLIKIRLKDLKKIQKEILELEKSYEAPSKKKKPKVNKRKKKRR